MNGAESLVKTLLDGGVEVCFTNPGTSEMHFVAALDAVPGMQCVLCLFEGVASGAADGYARVTGKPASTLFHLGPGLGNGLANLHNLKKSCLPVINIVGDHATYHLQYEAPLTSDIEGIARPVSDWVKTSATASDIAIDTAEAITVAARNQVATLILPADVSWEDNPSGPVQVASPSTPAKVDQARIEQAAGFLLAGNNSMLYIGDCDVDEQRGLTLSRIAKEVGARVMVETFMRRTARGAGCAPLERLPYLAEQAIAQLAEVDNLLLIGASAPVAFFAYPGVPSVIAPPDCQSCNFVAIDEDIDDALERLLEAVGGVDQSPDVTPLERLPAPSGQLNPETLAAVIARHIPENAVVVDEGVTAGLAVYPATATARRHDWMCVGGGSIGWGLPCAVGAAIGAPDKKVICLSGDGSAMYTLQALWTMARENLDIAVVIFANRRYKILEMEFARTGAPGGRPGHNAASMFDIDRPDLDFVSMSEGMGVPAVRVETAEQFDAALEAAVSAPGTRLVEVVLPAN